MTNKILEILEDEPQKLDSTERSPELDPSDFTENSEVQTEEPEEDPGPGENPEEIAQPSESGPEASPGSEDEEKKEEPELSAEEQKKKENIAQIKKEVAESLLDPETAVALFDMVMSRLCTIQNKSNKDDWKLDDDEIKIFEKLMVATMEEEGMEFWPAKYWIIVAIIMIYAFKGWDVWENYYSEEAQEKERKKDPKVQNEETRKRQKDAETEVQALQDLVDAENKKKELLEELDILTGPSDNGTDKQAQESAPGDEEEEETEEAEAQEVTNEDTNDTDEIPEKIDPEKWKNYRHRYDPTGNLIRNKDGSPKKRPGLKPGQAPNRNKQGHFLAPEK